MSVIRIAISELIGMFIDDGSLAALAVILILAVTAAIKLAALPPLIGGLLLLVGCLAILAYSVRRAVKR
ncbi:hypothetical protein DTW90_21455 [Neorhizobium sp. P12A]|jgi:hypothetical protein|uniref:hypothetical protein n=1 Tax=Rhizobium/Agrobacterium group TaxID=227290 RepID=UPI0010483E98|nr:MULTISPECIES: hypothetical protein [Rhizobium/Agrobacterium group]KAA0697304.1 hypothetical protein DTW90_21455 [Neorhizobium sp. P12A]TCR85815.1 hypothetical protein EV561_10677 [Rhizobium sp. BK376]